jgi:hypothetical protein
MATEPGKAQAVNRTVQASLLVGMQMVAALAQASAATFQEDFATDPLARGWRVFGDRSLFGWDSNHQQLRVTWDSSRTNSYFAWKLGTVLGNSDDFSLAFDLRLEEARVGVDPAKPFTFELAIGFIHLATATATNFARGTGIHPLYGPRNLVEFAYFPDTDPPTLGATVAPTVVSTNNQFAFSHNFPLELTLGDWFRVEMAYWASNRVLRTRLWRNGQPFGLPPDQRLGDVLLAQACDFRVDTLAISSYSDTRAGGSLLARGVVDNIQVDLPPPPVQNLVGRFDQDTWIVRFHARTNWLYSLERTTDWRGWEAVGLPSWATRPWLELEDRTAPRLPAAFYRVRAERP